MLFDLYFGLEQINRDLTTQRVAVRAVAIRNGKLLLNKTNSGDCKLPGGGVGFDEDLYSALKREVQEETGYTCAKVSERIGRATERRADFMDKSRFFEMESHYYVVVLSEEQGEQKLDDYEQNMGFTPVWMSIDEAICANRNYIETCADKNQSAVYWAQRELGVFEKLKEIGVDNLKKIGCANV